VLIYVSNGSYILTCETNTFSGDSVWAILAEGFCSVILAGSAGGHVISGTPEFAHAFVELRRGATLSLRSNPRTLFTNAANATGIKAIVDSIRCYPNVPACQIRSSLRCKTTSFLGASPASSFPSQ
jgi:hypothetical protein